MLLSNTLRQRSTPITSSVNSPWSAGESFAKRAECSSSDAYASVFSIRSRTSNAAARAGETGMNSHCRRSLTSHARQLLMNAARFSPAIFVVHYKTFDGKIIGALLWMPFNLKQQQSCDRAPARRTDWANCGLLES